MEKVCVCKCCGRTINEEFIYCPWCGESRLKMTERDSMEAVFDVLVESQNRERERHVSYLKDRLDELDKELSSLVLSVEMHR